MELDSSKKAISYLVVDDIHDEVKLSAEQNRQTKYLDELGIRHAVGFVDVGARGLGWEMLEKFVDYHKGQYGIVLLSEFDQLSKDVGWILLKQAEFEEKYGVTIHSIRDNQLGVDKDHGLSFR